jgi:hypothetical protein
MPAGKISMTVVNDAVNPIFVHIFSINNGSAIHFLQGPDNVWVSGGVPSNPPAQFSAIKVIYGQYVDLDLVLFALDVSGRLWWSSSDANGNWGAGWQQMPAGTLGSTFQSFDVDCNYNAGLVVVVSYPGTQATTDILVFDGTNWTPGWNNTPSSYAPYEVDHNGAVYPVPLAFPPILTSPTISDNGGNQDTTAPIVMGLSVSSSPPPYPECLFQNAETSDWQWSQLPVVVNKISRPHGFLNVPQPPYPVNVQSLFLGGGAGAWEFIMFLIGDDGNIYYNVSTGLGQGWEYEGVLPNPNKLKFTKVVEMSGFPIDQNELGVLQVIALGQEAAGDSLFPFLFTLSEELMQSNPPWSWSWENQLPAPVPSPSFVDCDIAFRPDTLSVQVGLLGSDGNVFINYQTQSGWNWYFGLQGKGLP